jgi:hypothetical protein
VPLQSSPDTPWGTVLSIAVAPGDPSRFAVACSGTLKLSDMVGLVEGGVLRPATTPPGPRINALAFDTHPAVLFGADTYSSAVGLYAMLASSRGVNILTTRTVNSHAPYGFAIANGIAYFSSGQVWHLEQDRNWGQIDARGPLAVYPAAGIVAVANEAAGTAYASAYELRFCDLQRYVVVDRFALPGVTNRPRKLERMGDRGFALLTDPASPTHTESISGSLTLVLHDPALRPALGNASARGVVGSGDDVMITGLVVHGTTARNMLVRVLGPTLEEFGVADVLDDPVLELYSGSTKIGENDGWRSADADTQRELARLQISPGSDREPAILRSLAPGSYTAIVRAKPGQRGGVALVEAFDAQAYGTRYETGTAKAANLSARARVRTGSDVLITGFVIGGDVPRRILLTGLGPTLAGFGVSSVLVNPRLELFQGSRKITENDDWIDSPQFDEIVNTANSPGNLAEPAILVTLAPGAYTAVLSGVNDTQGVALAEVYDARPLQDIRFARPSISNLIGTLNFSQASGPIPSVVLTFLAGTTATLAGGPLGTSNYAVTGPNTANLFVSAANGFIAGSLRFYRPHLAQFRGTLSLSSQPERQVVGTLLLQ